MSRISLNMLQYYGATFAAGFALMVVEIVSSRIVAPIIGSSIFTWTSVIGITLLGLSVGSFLGGYLADRYTKRYGQRVIAYAFLAAACLVYAILPLSRSITSFLDKSSSLLSLSLFVSTKLFLLPAIALGTLAPIIFRSYVDSVNNIGKKYGLLSGIWSLGSIVGVFATGFYFVPTLGSTNTVRLVALLLVLIFYFFYLHRITRRDIPVFLLVTLGCLYLVMGFFTAPEQLSKNILFHKETAYYDMRVADYKLFPNYGKNKILFLDIDTHSVQTEKPSQRFYTDIAPLFSAFSSDIKNIYVIGAGAYTLPINLKKYYSDARVTVGEIDPEVERVGRAYFNVGAYDIQTEIGDARMIFGATGAPKKQYDLIYGDAYNSFISVPWYLLTKEFVQDVRGHLAPDGVYAVNFAGTLEGSNAELFESIYSTMHAVFPNTHILAFGHDYTKTQNITIVGVNSSDFLASRQLAQKLDTIDETKFLSSTLVDASSLNNGAGMRDGLILTDDFAPVERMMTGLMEEYFPKYITLYNKITG